MTDGSSDDTGGPLLRMLDPDETFALNYADAEDYDIAFLSNHKRRGGTSHVINHEKVLTTKQADFVNKELNTGKGTISIKKIVMQEQSFDTELDNTYQKALLTENNKK